MIKKIVEQVRFDFRMKQRKRNK